MRADLKYFSFILLKSVPQVLFRPVHPLFALTYPSFALFSSSYIRDPFPASHIGYAP